MRDLFEAIDKGFISTDFVAEHVRAGYVRPSLVNQIERRIEDPLLLPRNTKAKDQQFVAPFRSLPKHAGSPWGSRAQLARAVLRKAYQRTPLYGLQRRVRNRMSM